MRLPGTGAMVAMLAAAPAFTPIGVGKPEPIMYELAMAQMDARPETTAAVGDRVMTDIVLIFDILRKFYF
jgi:ribonucleotide monophosphatase NagD (HAD superfamily)